MSAGIPLTRTVRNYLPGGRTTWRRWDIRSLLLDKIDDEDEDEDEEEEDEDDDDDRAGGLFALSFANYLEFTGIYRIWDMELCKIVKFAALD